MRVRLTPTELADILTGLIRDETGMVWVDIPDACIQREAPRLVLANPNIVRYGDRHAKLTSTQHAILRFVLSQGASEHEDVIHAVWGRAGTTSGNLATQCSLASKRLLDAGIPASLSAADGHVTFNQP